MAYIEVRFPGIPKETMEVLIAQLADMQYEGFEETEDELKAYISEELFDNKLLGELAKALQGGYTADTLPDTNWNQVWESNFTRVIVEDFCAIRADFHEPINSVNHEIVITPKMSFGTGHHPTTYMMIEQMREVEFTGRSVLDFGTGTGVLAILAQKLGASRVVAIDNDDWSITNAEENARKNDAGSVEIIKGDSAAASEEFDIILANITRNVILDNFRLFASNIRKNGTLLLSGLLFDDEKIILTEAEKNGFDLKSQIRRNNWICLRLNYS
jgi:ribosomal protein L11 methyltransferase